MVDPPNSAGFPGTCHVSPEITPGIEYRAAEDYGRWFPAGQEPLVVFLKQAPPAEGTYFRGHMTEHGEQGIWSRSQRFLAAARNDSQENRLNLADAPFRDRQSTPPRLSIDSAFHE